MVNSVEEIAKELKDWAGIVMKEVGKHTARSAVYEDPHS
jgi:hypothetical protein